MTRKSAFAVASLFFLLGTADLAFIIREYRQGTTGTGFSYTQFVKERDIGDDAASAFEALADAELHEVQYVLTGETQYFDVFHKELQTWEDEAGTLQLVARKADAGAYVRELSEAGRQVVNELNLISAIYEKSGQAAAIERLRKGGAIYYLDQAQRPLGTIRDFNLGGQVVRKFTDRSMTSSRRMAAAAGVLFVMLAAASALAVFQTRRAG
jgi:CHASE3 domain sensor protein